MPPYGECPFPSAGMSKNDMLAVIMMLRSTDPEIIGTSKQELRRFLRRQFNAFLYNRVQEYDELLEQCNSDDDTHDYFSAARASAASAAKAAEEGPPHDENGITWVRGQGRPKKKPNAPPLPPPEDIPTPSESESEEEKTVKKKKPKFLTPTVAIGQIIPQPNPPKR